MFKRGEKVRLNSIGISSGYLSDIKLCPELTIVEGDEFGVTTLAIGIDGKAHRVYSHHLEYTDRQIEEWKKSMKDMLQSI